MRKFLVLMTACLLISINASAGDDQSAAPYLYYYSDILDAFVIERADGTDSRLFGAGMMPDGYNRVDGPGWSPSGKWFAWENINRSGSSKAASPLYIVGVDGTTQRNFKNKFTDGIIWSRWSPTEDILAVMEWSGDYEFNTETLVEYMPIRFSLLDVGHDKIITEFDVNPVFYGPEMFWSPDGKFMAFLYQYRVIGEYKALLHIISSQGKVEDRPIATFAHYLGYFPEANIWSAGGWIAYSDVDNNMVIEHPADGQRFNLGQFEEPATILWSPVQDYALIYVDESVGTTSHETMALWLLSVKDKNILPVEIEARYVDFQLHGSPKHWSSDAEQAALQDWEGFYYIFSLDLNTLKRLEIANEVGWYGFSAQWVNQNRQVIFSVDDRENRIYATYRYDTLTEKLERFDNFYSMGVSADGRYFSSLAILDTVTRKIAPTPISRATTSDDDIRDIRWHPEQAWRIKVTKNSSLSVIRADGTNYRELGPCFLSEICANWLPPQVNVEDLPPGQPNSVLQAPESVMTYDEWDAIGWGFDEPNLTFTRECDPYDNRTFIVNDTLTGQTQQFKIGCGDLTNNGADFSPDRRLFAAGAPYKPIYIWDFKTGELLAKLNSYAFKLAFSPDGTRLAAQLNGETVLIWNVSNVVEAAQDE